MRGLEDVIVACTCRDQPAGIAQPWTSDFEVKALPPKADEPVAKAFTPIPALAAVVRSGRDELAVNLGAGLIDHNDRECTTAGARIVAHLPRQVLAVLDRAADRRKFQPFPVPDRNSVPHVEIIGSHGLPRRPSN
jgi:hypothetical protein